MTDKVLSPTVTESELHELRRLAENYLRAYRAGLGAHNLKVVGEFGEYAGPKRIIRLLDTIRAKDEEIASLQAAKRDSEKRLLADAKLGRDAARESTDGGWISVGDRLPEVDAEVWIWNSTRKKVRATHYLPQHSDKFPWNGDGPSVSHWMPREVPSPPNRELRKEESNG